MIIGDDSLAGDEHTSGHQLARDAGRVEESANVRTINMYNYTATYFQASSIIFDGFYLHFPKLTHLSGKNLRWSTLPENLLPCMSDLDHNFSAKWNGITHLHPLFLITQELADCQSTLAPDRPVSEIDMRSGVAPTLGICKEIRIELQDCCLDIKYKLPSYQ